ncbi:MAG: MFS transporter, partial [Ktedonobacteraceae bacterium]|nr:MFS transporter [Ktedonobacteraceae bacterium]
MSEMQERLFLLWRNRDYLLLVSGQNISRLGTGISQLAFPLLALTLTGSAAQAGIIGTLAFIPQLLFGLVVGALVDRLNRKRVMIICDLGRAAVFASIALLHSLRALPIFLLYFLVPVDGILAVFFNLSATARLPHVVERDQLPTAVAQDQMALAVISLLSPFFGELLYSLAPFCPFLVDALSYLFSAASLSMMKTSFQEERTSVPRSLPQQIRDGLFWLWQQPVLRSLTFLLAAVLFAASGNSLLVILLAKTQQTSPFVIGLIFTLTGLGGILGSLVAIPIQRRFRFGQITVASCWGLVLCWSFYPLAHVSLALGAIGAGLSIMSIIFDVALHSYRLGLIPDSLRGRVSSITNLLASCSRATGIAVTGFLLELRWIFPTIAFLWGFLFLAAVI